MQLRVTQFGEPVLREVGSPVLRFDAKLRALAQDMLETMYAEDGIGIAAPQVDRALQLFVIDVSDLDPAEVDFTLDGKSPPLELVMPLAVVNPKLRLLEGEPVVAEEGCLSFPGLRGKVPRASAVEMEFQDLEGRPRKIEARGWIARVLQHEYDHLQGVLYIDRMDAAAVRALDPKLKQLKRATKSFLRTREKSVEPA